MAMDLNSQLEKIDALIRSARATDAALILQSIPRAKIPLNDRFKVAALARRAGISEVSILLLRPLVRPTSKVVREATSREVSEYAAALLRLGSIHEAMSLLKKVKPSEVPESLSFQGHIHMKEWNYAAASDCFREYLKLPISAYEKLVGEMNLAACLVLDGPFGEARTLLGKIIEETSQKANLNFLKANSVRLLGNVELSQGNLSAALSRFVESEKDLQGVGGLEHFFARKWIAIARFLMNPEKSEEIDILEQEAKQLGHWETVRHFDHYRVLGRKDRELFLKLYFGTPLPHFRSKLESQASQFEIPNEYFYRMGSGKKKLVPTLDPTSIDEKGSEALKPGKAIHRTYTALISDFYRPFSVYTLFEAIFPGEFYSPKVSEYRVHQSLKRLRAFFEKNKLPLTIEMNKNLYSLSSEKDCAVLTRIEQKVGSQKDFRIGILRKTFVDSFGIHDAAKALGIARRTAGTLMLEAVSDGTLEKISRGSQTRYRFKEDLKKAG